MLVKSLRTGPRHPTPTCTCKSWLDHWENNRFPKEKMHASYCRACGEKFNHSDLVGGHVIKVNSLDEQRYIVPLCYTCNNKEPFPFNVKNSDDLISANCDYCINK